jgi:hypothetical protein
MLAATLGLLGVLVGAFVSHALSASWQRRRERLDALVVLVAATARVIGAKERLFDLVFYGALPATSDQVQQALTDRADAHAEWRTAHARAAILIPANEPLNAAVERFRLARDSADAWIIEYLRLGAAFSFADHKEGEHESWQAMRQARLDCIAAAQVIVLEDASWLPLLRKQRSRRKHRRAATLIATQGVATDPPADPEPASR